MLAFVLVLCLIALVSIGAGLVPLYTRLDTHAVATVGSGIILGTAFVLIIPEGVDVMSKSGESSVIGPPILFGYLLMYFLDAIFSLQQQAPVAVDLEGANNDSFSLGASSHSTRLKLGSLARHSIYLEDMSLTTLGMIIHSAADGISLGAAYSLESAHLQITVLLSILVHKAPASFSLTTVLQAEGIKTPVIKRDLLVFALSAPLAAIITRLAVSGSKEFQWWAGLALLFSGGTFTFVAVHIQPQIKAMTDMVLLGVGALVPLVASLVPE